MRRARLHGALQRAYLGCNRQRRRIGIARTLHALPVLLCWQLLTFNAVAAGPPPVITLQPASRTTVLAGTATPEEEDLPEIRAEGGDAEPNQEGEPEAPAPNYECPDFWGNSDIWSYSNAP